MGAHHYVIVKKGCRVPLIKPDPPNPGRKMDHKIHSLDSTHAVVPAPEVQFGLFRDDNVPTGGPPGDKLIPHIFPEKTGPPGQEDFFVSKVQAASIISLMFDTLEYYTRFNVKCLTHRR